MNEEKRAKLAKMRKALKDAGITTKRKFVKLTCTRCFQERKIQTANKDIYTDEVRAKFICLTCK
jgi:hypothetical protein